MRWLPRGYGGERRPAEQVKREGWTDQNILVVSADDQRLTPGQSASWSVSSAKSFTGIIVGSQPVDRWTVETVEMRLEDAAQVMRRLPPVRVPGYFNTWPSMMVEFADCVGREARPMRLPPPSSVAITRMEEALGWLRWLEAEDAKLVWARSDRAPWKAICCRFGISRATANRRHQYALSLIAWRLNGRRPPTKRSRNVLIERMRHSSSTI